MSSGGVASTGCCCEVDDCADFDRYVLYPSCGSKKGASCLTIGKVDALANNISIGDVVRTRIDPPFPDTTARRTYLVGCENAPPADCGDYGADTSCQGPSTNYTLTSANSFLVCSGNSCEGCYSEGFPPREGDVAGAWQNSWNTCSSQFAGCMGLHYQPDDYDPEIPQDVVNEPPCFGRCMSFSIDDVTIDETASRYPGYKFELKTIGNFFLGSSSGFTNIGGTVDWDCGQYFSGFLIIDYDITSDLTEEPECCNLPVSDPDYCGDIFFPPSEGTGCCDAWYQSTGGRVIFQYLVEYDSSEGVRFRGSFQSINNNLGLIQNSLGLVADLPTTSFGGVGCGGGAWGLYGGTGSIKNQGGYTPAYEVDECLPCSSFNVSSGVFNFPVGISGITTLLGGCAAGSEISEDLLCNGLNTSGDYYNMSITFSMNSTAPTPS